ETEAPLLRSFDDAAMERLIYRCAELHLDHIATSGDPFETGSSRPLDFGHWAAHKLEQLSDYQLRHGEAVAIGIALDTLYSRDIGLLDAAAASRILDLLETLGFELFAPELARVNSEGKILLLEGIEEFREHLGGELNITLLREIGRGIEVHEIRAPLMLQGVRELESRQAERAKLLQLSAR
ncbi:MAG TPA: 3-dehydroquinate synthase, partial [Verrucomicrobiae bacterium]|nr:3-dehydroquinate synthase [Verrucomicrobiae bacterium]